MPALELHGPCTFDGDVASVRVEGHGHAKLLERAPFEGGHARKVWLEGATISTAPPNPELSQPRLLVPVDVNNAESDYDVTYKAGLPIVVEINRGGENGSFQGMLDRAPRCASEWCTVTWTGATKHVELYPAGEAPFALTKEFPLGEAVTSPAMAEKTAPPSVNRIEMSGASGSLSCADGGQDVAGDWRWPGRGVRDLWLGPVKVTGRTLHVVVKNRAKQGTLEPIVPDGGAAASAASTSAASSSAASTGQDPVDPRGQGAFQIRDVLPVAAIGVAAVVALVALKVRASTAPSRDAPSQPKQSTTAPKEAPNMTKLPDPLVKAYRAGKLALFVGSGMSLGGDVKGGFPLWGKIPERLLDACARYDVLDEEAIALKRAQFKVRMSLEQMLAELGVLRTALGLSYQAALNDIFRPDEAAPGAAHRAVAALGVGAILTTNYDQLFERLHETPPRQPYSWKEADRALADVKAGRRVLFKIHGTVERHETVVMSDREYDAARADASYQAVLRYLLQDHVLLFLGYGMNDPLDLDLAFKGNVEAFKSAAQRHYLLLRNPTDLDRDRLERAYNVRVIAYAEHGEVPEILARLAAAKAG